MKDDIQNKVVLINGVARAFFEAPAVREVCVELPDEDLSSSDRNLDRVGHLAMSLYGTRDAAMNWQEEVAKEMKRWGFCKAIVDTRRHTSETSSSSSSQHSQ